MSWFIMLLATPAHALSCMWGVTAVNIDGGPVPENVQILVEHTFESASQLNLTLTDAAGNNVAFDLVEDRTQHAVLRPVELLPAGEYLLQGDEDTFWNPTTFTVVPGLDTLPPVAPTLLDATAHRESTEWGDTAYILGEVQPVADASHYEFEIATSPDFSDAARVSTTSTSALLGQGLCSNSVPSYDRSESYHLRVRSVDLAGNVSGWTTTDDTVPRGCSSAGSTGSLALGSFACLALFARRRR